MSRKKTAAQKKREGEKDKSKTDKTDLKFDGELKMPLGMTNAAKLIWRKVVPSLVKSGLASKVDQPCLQSLCEWWSLYRDSFDTLKTMETGTIEYGRTMVAITKSFDQFRRLAIQYGLTANSRTGIEMLPPSTDETDKFFT